MSLPHPIRPADVIAAFPEYALVPTPLGEGAVKSAFRIHSDTSTVLKVIRVPLGDDTTEASSNLAERFRREIEVMRDINHPSIVRILSGPDVRPINDRDHVWYIEPLYPGGTLATRLVAPWPEDACVTLLTGLVNAVEALAQIGAVHRDIKPSNIVFDSSDRPVLLDLGIVYLPEFSSLTESWHESPKTPAYAAPEQFTPRSNAIIDFRTDLFLIGIVVFEALTGKHPFNPNEQAGYVTRISSCDWNNSALDQVAASEEMRQILHRLLQPLRSRRYRTIEQLRAAIQECR